MSKAVGRPRTELYVPIVEFVQQWKEFEARFNSIKKQYQIYYIIAHSFQHVVHPILEVVGTIRSAWHDEPYLGEHKMPTFKWRTVATQMLRDRKTGRINPGEAVVVDLDHDPPRLRILLTNGKRIETPLRCPQCPKTKERRSMSESWKDQDILFIEEVPVQYKTVDGFERRMACYGGHVNWRVEDVKRYLRNLGLMK